MCPLLLSARELNKPRRMDRDKILIGEFLCAYNEYYGTTFRVTKYPDKLAGRGKAIDAIAQDDDGLTLAIEHTLIQPIIGEKDDAQRLLTMLAPLEADVSLRAPRKSIAISLAVGAIPKGPDWKEASAKVVAWFRERVATVPLSGTVGFYCASRATNPRQI
jgi:hypothetical protein